MHKFCAYSTDNTRLLVLVLVFVLSGIGMNQYLDIGIGINEI